MKYTLLSLLLVATCFMARAQEIFILLQCTQTACFVSRTPTRWAAYFADR